MDLLEREAELATLDSALNDAGGGSGSVILVSGEAGIGKTRLAEEVVESVTRQGFAVVRARATRDSVPFAPVTQWLRSRSITAVLDLVEDIWLTEITRLLPELARKRPDLPTPESLSEGWQRQPRRDADQIETGYRPGPAVYLARLVPRQRVRLHVDRPVSYKSTGALRGCMDDCSS